MPVLSLTVHDVGRDRADLLDETRNVVQVTGGQTRQRRARDEVDVKITVAARIAPRIARRADYMTLDIRPPRQRVGQPMGDRLNAAGVDRILADWIIADQRYAQA